MYPLESSSPDHLASLLERLIQETTQDKDGKIEKITPKTEEQITIVPDPNTFSLIVYASQKNQKWIEGLITRLDKRRPQVLIDVTLGGDHPDGQLRVRPQSRRRRRTTP